MDAWRTAVGFVRRTEARPRGHLPASSNRRRAATIPVLLASGGGIFPNDSGQRFGSSSLLKRVEAR